MSAPYSPAAVANEFLLRGLRGSRILTPLQIQKLTYITHGWYLGVTGQKLFDEAVEAWDHGPVIPSLYHEFKRFGRDPITHLAHNSKDIDDEPTEPFVRSDDADANNLIDWVWNKYGGKSGGQLRALTHAPGTPWAITKDNDGAKLGTRSKIIDTGLIKQHYQELWAKWAKANERA